MTMISSIAAASVLIGLFILVIALASLRRLIAMIPVGSLRNKWFAMAGLIFLFIAGYLGYIVVLWGQQTKWEELPISGLFLFGAIFVWLALRLSLQTAIDLLRIEVLEAENITDPLTKIYNRRYLDRRLDEEIERSRRYSLDLTILMIDIDHFKQVNDRYGHRAGDVTLATLCQLIKANLRDLDVVARYGGEELLVICTNTDIDGTALVAERLRQLVESNQIEIATLSGNTEAIRISVSIGVAGLSVNDDNREEFVQAADEALYRAKSQGRNRVIISSVDA